MKLNTSIPSNSVKLIDLYNKITSGSLITGPDYQRKLVWKKQHKFAFIETILLNFPFPEVYIASAELDLAELKAREVVVDGQQRLTTIVEYIQGKNDFANQKSIQSFDDLEENEKRDFLNYLVPVKDLKDIGNDNIIEVFKRINSTNYSLNSNEVLNAQYGGGEFAIFCKALADKEFSPLNTETALEIDPIKRNFVNDFFENYRVFSNNDIKRMFDSQYIMLLTSTILEGHYFGRTARINYYLEKYNDSFDIHSQILDKIHLSLKIIDSLDFSEKSYWFNKANLFTLIIEIIKLQPKELDLNRLEQKLNELEYKSDLYFVGEEEQLKLITSDEMKYFEVARQGSHELSSREHRSLVIKKVLDDSINSQQTNSNQTIQTLKHLKINFTTITPTETGLSKSIIDATKNVRDFLSQESLHDYENQGFGPDNKITLNAALILESMNEKVTETSLYRSTGRGDYRIWFTSLSDFAEPLNELILLNLNGLKILNSSKYDYSEWLSKNAQ